MESRELDGMYELADDFGIDRAVTGNAAFIFDRYLSMCVPSYIKGTVNLTYRFVVIRSASLLIAAKLHMSKSELGPIKNFVSERENHYSGEIFQAELEILVKLQWDAMYPSPISIIDDMLTLLPCPRSFLDYVELEAFKCLILKFVHPLVKLASVKYGYVTEFPPSTIALAALMIAIDKLQPSSQDVEMRKIPIFRLISFATSVKSGLGRSSVDVDVKKCRQWMMEHSKDDGLKADTPEKIPCPSPANVCEFCSNLVQDRSNLILLFHFICKRPKVFLSLELHEQSRNIYQTFLLHT